ncbi:AI-2E family transporter [Halioglobus japonicus]|uniref:AI-2E family transporter n=1 Tax=Halioglobus japonicus TaxID=930805 RepID=A0AAP8MHE8_9GAMM|nr:AI-2E family transporter [Halioglobus japonicus]AQA19500.1 AI-2E family transporter [Halioglobus japonicus]PLW87439.1 AI-2E family transporter [Halioglobus japonicus]GHD08464.1 AI-2E family transporter [Halioglobus japonicus]
MSDNEQPGHAMTVQEFTDALIRVGLVALMVVASFRVFSPFLSLMIWALILAVTIYPLHQGLAARLGGNQGRASTVIVIVGLLGIGIPVVLLGGSLAEHATSIADRYHAGTLELRPPKENVANWPVVGEDVYNAWSAASENLPAFIQANKTSLESLITSGMSAAKSTVGTVLLFLGSLIVAGIMMAFGHSANDAMENIVTRIVGPKHGAEVHNLATMTTRSVAAGVLGVAFIQAVLVGIGLLGAGVPAAGLLALVVLLLAIMQLPAALVVIPVVIWIFKNGDNSQVMAIVWSVYLVVAGLADNVLKPMLLGRGVEAPMPVILLGALGGMMSMGFVGLFVGAVILAVGYQLFMKWVAMHEAEEAAEAAAAAASNEEAEASE